MKNYNLNNKENVEPATPCKKEQNSLDITISPSNVSMLSSPELESSPDKPLPSSKKLKRSGPFRNLDYDIFSKASPNRENQTATFLKSPDRMKPNFITPQFDSSEKNVQKPFSSVFQSPDRSLASFYQEDNARDVDYASLENETAGNDNKYLWKVSLFKFYDF